MSKVCESCWTFRATIGRLCEKCHEVRKWDEKGKDEWKERREANSAPRQASV
jgi:hypothetical protein